MQGQAYCFPVKNIDAHSLPTDSGAGFLLLVPVENDAVVECNQRHYSLDDHFAYPHIQASVGEVSYEDTPQAYAQRLRENRLGQTNSDLERPLQRFGIYGLDCYRYRSDAVYRNDAMCTGGTGGAPVFYLSCSKDGSLPNPSCQDEFVYNGLVYRISYNKRCQPHHDVIRQWIIRFVDEGRSRAAQ